MSTKEQSTETEDAEDKAILAEYEARRKERDVVFAGLEQRLNVPTGSLRQIVEGEKDDWAFIVKLAVFVEATLTDAIISHLGKPELFEHIANLSQHSRLELAFKLGVLEKSDRMTFGALSTVRNQFAHDVRNMHVPLAAFVDRLERSQKESLVAHLVVPLPPRDKTKGPDDFNWLPKWFRILIHASVVNAIFALVIRGDEKRKERERSDWAKMMPLRSLAELFNTPHHGHQTLLTASPDELTEILEKPSKSGGQE